MRCKKHLSDFTSTVGVCATCLRERLLPLLAVQDLGQARGLSRAGEVRVKSNVILPPPPAPPLVFPRSVSPYVSRRKSVDDRDYRFYSTPQVGPTFSAAAGAAIGGVSCKKKSSRFSVISNFFRSRSVKQNPDLMPSDDPNVTSSSSSSSWFSTMLSSRRNKQTRFYIDDYTNAGGRKPSRIPDRGMSPVRDLGFEDDCDRSPSGSGYSSESSQGWKRTPVAALRSTTRRGKAGHVSGLAFCLSPLVRANPNRQWNHKGGLPPEMSFPGQVRCPVKPHLSNAASSCANRSRKLADMGRANNR